MKLKQSCPLGLTNSDLDEVLGDKRAAFNAWMVGQTGVICNGLTYHHNRRHTAECGHLIIEPYDWKCDYPGGGHHEKTSCSDNPHGYITYSWDVQRFLDGLDPID